MSLTCSRVLVYFVSSQVPKMKLSEEPSVIVGVGCVIKTRHLEKKKKKIRVTHKFISASQAGLTHMPGTAGQYL